MYNVNRISFDPSGQYFGLIIDNDTLKFIKRAGMVNGKVGGGIKRAIFNEPYTIVLWNDGTKTILKCCEGDTYDKEKGLAMAIIKRMFGPDCSNRYFMKAFDRFTNE